MALTKRQREVLAFIERFLREHGYSPSLGEIAEGLGLKSPSTVHKHLVNLERQELIDRTIDPRSGIRSRAINLVPGIASRAVVEVPMLGWVSAGKPLELVEDAPTIGLPPEMVRSKETFVLRVSGDSMIEEQLRDGDMLIVEPRKTAQDGETVMALIKPENSITVKKFYQENEQIRLQPANESMLPMIFPAVRVELKGIIVGVLRKY